MMSTLRSRLQRIGPRRRGPRHARPGELDIVYLTDLRFPGGTSTSLAEEARAARRAGYSIGVFPLISTSLQRDRPIHPEIQALIDAGEIHLVIPGAQVRARLAIVKHPTVLPTPFGAPLPIEAEQVIITVGQVPRDGDGTPYYDCAQVDRAVTEALGTRPHWLPISPTVRRALLAEGIEPYEQDWVEIIDPGAWWSDHRPDPRSTPVIGRHSRPDPAKWPRDAATMLAAYPDDPTLRVRVLGGDEAALAVLGSIPDNWEVLAFRSVEAQTFLAGIDYFVYFHSPDLVEAFGRTLLEAVASGVVCITSDSIAELFGEACVYTEPAGVVSVVREFHADTHRYADQVRIARAVVDRRFSHQAHLNRLRELIGPPGAQTCDEATWVEVPPAVRAQIPTVVISCLGMSRARVAAVIREAAAQRDRTAAFRPIIVGTVRAPAEAALFGIDYQVIIGRAKHRGDPSTWPEYALHRIGALARSWHADAVVPADVTHPDAWIALRAGLPPNHGDR